MIFTASFIMFSLPDRKEYIDIAGRAIRKKCRGILVRIINALGDQWAIMHCILVCIFVDYEKGFLNLYSNKAATLKGLMS